MQRSSCDSAKELAGLNNPYDYFAADRVAEQNGHLASLHKVDVMPRCTGGPKEISFRDMMGWSKCPLRRQTAVHESRQSAAILMTS